MTDAIYNRFEIEVERAYYILKRYDVISTFALLYFDKELSAKQLGTYLRISDTFFLIDDNTYFINFPFSSQKDTFKACENLLLELDNYFNDRNSCICIESLDTNLKPKVLLNKLIQILEETKKSSYGRIEDESILNHIV